MDTTLYAESDNVTAQVVKDSQTKKATIIADAHVEEVNFSGKLEQKLTLLVNIDGRKKKYRPNKASLKNIIGTLGAESTKWIGKTLRLSVMVLSGKDCVVAQVE